MGMRTWLTNLGEAAQVRLLNVQLDKLYRKLGLSGDGASKDDDAGPIISYPISLDKGGTGATDPQKACENLEASHKDHTHTELLNSLSVGGPSSASDDDPKFESHYPAHFYAGIGDFGKSVQGGLVTRSSPSVAAQSYKDYTVTFPVPFKNTPMVQCSLYTWSTSYYMGGFSVAVVGGTVTKTGFTVRCFNSTSSARDFHLSWLAIGEM